MIYITGDIHANLDRKRLSFFKSLKEDDIVVVLGDFGFSWNEKFQNSWNALNIKCLVLSVLGNHENYNLIKSCAVERVFGANTLKLNPHTFYLMNGEIYDQENNPEKEYPFLFGHHHNFKQGSKYTCLYNQVMSVQKKEGKMILDRVI